MWPNPQKIADLVTFTKEMLNANQTIKAHRGKWNVLERILPGSSHIRIEKHGRESIQLRVKFLSMILTLKWKDIIPVFHLNVILCAIWYHL